MIAAGMAGQAKNRLPGNLQPLQPEGDLNGSIL